MQDTTLPVPFEHLTGALDQNEQLAVRTIVGTHDDVAGTICLALRVLQQPVPALLVQGAEHFVIGIALDGLVDSHWVEGVGATGKVEATLIIGQRHKNAVPQGLRHLGDVSLGNLFERTDAAGVYTHGPALFIQTGEESGLLKQIATCKAAQALTLRVRDRLGSRTGLLPFRHPRQIVIGKIVHDASKGLVGLIELLERLMIAGELGVFLNAREGNPLEGACALILLDHRAIFLLKPAPGGEGLLPPVGSSGQLAGDLECMTEEAVAENERAATEVLADPLDAGLKLGTLHIRAAQTYTEHAALASLGEALLEPLWGHPRDAGVVAVQADANDLRYL